MAIQSWVIVLEWSWDGVGPEVAATVDPADIRRLPTRVGSAARSGFVGSWLILDSGIPLTQFGHGPHNAVERARTSSLGVTRQTTTIGLKQHVLRSVRRSVRRPASRPIRSPQ